MSHRKIAVIGSGISGLGAAYHLNKNPNFEVHLFEAKDRLGGHSYTVDVDIEGQKIEADMGFLVFNDLTYPNLLQLFDELNIESHPSDMSFSVQIKDRKLEWCGSDTKTIFQTYRNLIRPGFYRMLVDILQFNKKAEFYLQQSKAKQWTLAHLIAHTKFSSEFYDWYLIPMGAAIWSTPYKKLLDFPAESFIRFFLNHRLLQVNDRPQWRSSIYGARDYVDKIASQLKHVHLNSPAIKIEKYVGGVQITTPNGTMNFNDVIFASSGQIAHELCKEVASEETLDVLKNFKTCDNLAVLHTDASLMPRKKRNWAAWNYHRNSAFENDKPVSLTYWLNTLKNYNVQTPLLVTLNPNQQIDSDKILHEVQFTHPMFDQKAINAQRRLPSIQGNDHLWFCGAWTRYGFHEDGYLSALNVVKHFIPEINIESESYAADLAL